MEGDGETRRLHTARCIFGRGCKAVCSASSRRLRPLFDDVVDFICIAYSPKPICFLREERKKETGRRLV